MWVLVVLWLSGSVATSQTITGFATEAACANAFNELHDKVTWGMGVKFVGKCVSLKEVPEKS